MLDFSLEDFKSTFEPKVIIDQFILAKYTFRPKCTFETENQICGKREYYKGRGKWFVG